MLLGLVLWLALAGSGAAAPPRDRLERFRELASERLATVEDTGGALDPAVQDEIEALLDDEVLESLRSGGPFASLAFIRDRLEAFGNAWGGASLRLEPLRGGFLLGRFRLSAKGVANSIRLYGVTANGPSLIRSWREDGVPEIYPWPERGGAPGFLVVWAGGQTGWGSWPARVTLWRVRSGSVTATWRSAERYPEALWVARLAVARETVFIRYELRYPGWKPGCEVQSEQEDLHRVDAASGNLTLVSRRLFNGWHRELQATVTRFFAAVAAGDGRGIAGLVPDAGLRAKLPGGLSPEVACDVQSPERPGTVMVAASAPLPDGRRSPWALWWSRGPAGWRLRGAAPVLQ
jgi:hypothetical protein